MYCMHCGQPLPPNQGEFCQNCGAPVQAGVNATNTPPVNVPPYYGQQVPLYIPPPVSYENADTLLKVVCFFFPIVGIILYFIDRDKKPVSAKQCLNMSLIAIGVEVGIVVLVYLFLFLFVFGTAMMFA